MNDTRLWRAAALVAALVAGLGVAAPAVADPRLAAAGPGGQANGRSIVEGISVDGRFVLFHSMATNLVAGDTHTFGSDHLFVRDRQAGTTELVDVTLGGGVPDIGIGSVPHLSSTGRYAVFGSGAPDLVAGDDNGLGDVFVRDLWQHTTELVSVAPAGGPTAGGSWPAGVSDDGRFVVFQSSAPDLDPTDTTPATPRTVYLRDRVLKTTQKIVGIPPESMAPGWSAVVSPDGMFVAVNTREVAGGSAPTPGALGPWGVSLYDLRHGTSQRISLDADGNPAAGEVDIAALSRDGRFAVFNSAVANLVAGDTNGTSDVVVRDVRAGSNTLGSLATGDTQASGWSFATSISSNGRFLPFVSSAGNLVPGDTNNISDVFVRDLYTGQTSRVSVASDGSQTAGRVSGAQVSDDGRYVTFNSDATTLVPDDTNNATDVFVHDTRTGTTERVSVG